MASRSKGTTGWRAALGAGALAAIFGAAIAAGPSGCGFSSNGLGTGGGAPGTGGSTSSSGGAGGATSSSSSSSSGSSGCKFALDCPASTDPCKAVTCMDGKCVDEAVTPGTPCTGKSGVCDQGGKCVACTEQNDETFGCPTDAGATVYCFNAACLSCGDTAQNGDETDTDCGGAHCPPCGDKQKCAVDTDCDPTAALVCEAVTHTCASCTNGVKDGSESDTDCGGSCTKQCGNGQTCTTGGDCTSGNCVGGICCDTMCAGSCQACALPGAVGKCTKTPQGVDGTPSCGASMTCDGNGACQALGAKKPVGQPCGADGDCANNKCRLGACRLKIGDYCSTDVECETDLCANHACAKCANNGDCGPGGVCQSSTYCKLGGHENCGTNNDCLIGQCSANDLCLHATGGSCAAAIDCATNRCVSGTCAPCSNDADCPGSKCFSSTCLGLPGDPCGMGTDCGSGVCMPSPIFGRCM